MATTNVSWTQHVFSSLVVFLIFTKVDSALLKEFLTADTDGDFVRLPRELEYRVDRQTSPSNTQTVSSSRPIKPEDSSDARDRDTLEKRCARCDYYYYNRDRDNRNPSQYDSRGSAAYDDRYDDRYYRERDRYYDDRYKDRTYEDDRRYYDTDRRYYDYDRDRYDRYDRRPESYDRNDRYDKNNVRYYERDRYDKNDLNRYYDRYDRVGYRPWDETTRGTSGFDNNGRGYYFSVGRPEYSSPGSGYASNWNNYSREDDRDRGWREQGFGGGSSGTYRPRDPYDPGYRGTSYLYGRPASSTTTELPNVSEVHSETNQPQPQDHTGSG